MENKTINIIHDDELEYVAKVTDTTIKLKHSKSNIWTDLVKDKKVGSIKDDGNGVRLKFGDVIHRLDYQQLSELYLLLDLKVKIDTNLMGKVSYHQNLKYIEQK